MRTCVALTLIILGSVLILIPLTLDSTTDNHTRDERAICQYAGIGMVLLGAVAAVRVPK